MCAKMSVAFFMIGQKRDIQSRLQKENQKQQSNLVKLSTSYLFSIQGQSLSPTQKWRTQKYQAKVPWSCFLILTAIFDILSENKKQHQEDKQEDWDIDLGNETVSSTQPTISPPNPNEKEDETLEEDENLVPIGVQRPN